MSRRRFCATSALGIGALGLGLVGCGPAKEADTQNATTDQNVEANATAWKRGLQLYTVRSLLENDFFGTLEQLKLAGISELEFAGYYDIPLDELAAYCKEKEFEVPSSHFSPMDFFDNPDKVIEQCKVMNHRYIVFPWLPPEMQNQQTYTRVIQSLNEVGKVAKEEGMQVCYHNHDFEFVQNEGEAQPYQRLLDETDPELVGFELDLYWAVHAGQDPIALLQRYPDRFPLCHVKDRAPNGSMMPVGSGAIDFAGIFKAHAFEHHFIEHDNPEDALASVQKSSAYLKETLRFS